MEQMVEKDNKDIEFTLPYKIRIKGTQNTIKVVRYDILKDNRPMDAIVNSTDGRLENKNGTAAHLVKLGGP